MRLTEDQFFYFARELRKTLTVSIALEKKRRKFYCTVSLHNPTVSEYDFFFVREEMQASDCLVAFDASQPRALQEAYISDDGALILVRANRHVPPMFKDWDVATIPAGGVLQFVIPVWREGDILRVGKKRKFWSGNASEVELMFGYYQLHSEVVPLPTVEERYDRSKAA